MLFQYTFRGLVARRRSVLPTILAVTITVGAVIWMLAYLEGLRAAMLHTGSIQNAVAMSQGAHEEDQSSVSLADVARIQVLPGIANPAISNVSVEFVGIVGLLSQALDIEYVTIRGVDEVAFSVHPEVKIEGKMPAHGENGIVLGTQLVGRYEGASVGGSLKIGSEKFQVTGILHAPGTAFDSEVWGDRASLMRVLKKTDPTKVVVRLESPSALSTFTAGVTKISSTLEGLGEREEFQRTADNLESSLQTYVRAVQIIILVLAVGAIFAAMNTIYSAMLDRMREFATLLAIGYTRGKVIMMVVQEALVISVAGAALGVGAGMLASQGEEINRRFNVIYHAQYTPMVLGVGIGVAAAIGLVGCIAAALKLGRLDVKEALRGA
jgi:putative ABC transport system permease protein